MTSCRGRHDTGFPFPAISPTVFRRASVLGSVVNAREGRAAGTWKAKETAIAKNENGNVR